MYPLMFVPYSFTLTNEWRRCRDTTKEKEVLHLSSLALLGLEERDTGQSIRPHASAQPSTPQPSHKGASEEEENEKE